MSYFKSGTFQLLGFQFTHEYPFNETIVFQYVFAMFKDKSYR